MSQAPLISVVIPVYNHARYVVDAITSVITQDWRPLELILIDDGSQDDSAAVIRTYLAETTIPAGVVVHFASRANKGAHNTINEGLLQAKGQYLAILNSDDSYLPGRLRRCVEAAHTHHSRMVFTYVDPIDDDGLPLADDHPWRGWYADVMMQELDLAPTLSALLLRYNIGISTGNFVFHRSLLDDVGLFNNFRYAHDIDYLLRVSLIEEPVLLRDKLYRYRLHDKNTISESADGINREYAEIVRFYFSRTLEQPPRNPFAPRLDLGAYTLAATPWPAHLGRAVDSLMAAPTLMPATTGASEREPTLTTAPRNARSHVTLVSHELSRTGAPVLLRDVASALHGRGVSTNVISLGTGPLGADFEAMDSPVVGESRLARLLSRSGGYLTSIAQDPRMPASFARGLRFVAKVSGGVGHRLRIAACRRAARGTLLINSFACWPLALPLLKRWNGNAYWYIHETYEPRLVMRNGKHLSQLRALVDQGKVKMLFGSDATRSKWASEGYDGDVCYWSGLPAALSAPLPETDRKASRRMILSVQATGPRKGTQSLIEAFAYGRRVGLIPTDVELRIIGCHPPSKNSLSRDLLVRINQPDLRNSVNLVPSLSPAALEEHYIKATIYVQSSTMECLPLALLTAMAHGLPIVTTDADGCREAILDGETGRLVPPRQIVLMAEALGSLLANPTEARCLGANARTRFVERFALEATVTPLLETVIGKG